MKIKTTIILLLVLTILLSSSIVSSQSVFDNNDSINVLVVGFGPFLNFSVNPSELIAAELDGEIINGAEVTGLQVLPNLSDFDESINIVFKAIDDLNPDYVFSIGLAAKYDYIRLEKIGYNFKIEIRENPRIEILFKGGKLLRISPFPTIKLAMELRKIGIPSQTGFYPGLSLCNGMLYAVLHYTDINDLDMKSGFIHVPLHKFEENPDGMELDTMVNAIRIIISECIDYFSQMPEFINSFFIIWCGFILYILFEIHMPCYVKKRKITVNEEKRLQEYIKKLENKGGRMQNKISD